MGFLWFFCFRRLSCAALAAVLGGGAAHRLFEHLGKIVYIQDAHLLRHHRDILLGGAQQIGRALDALRVDKICQGGSGVLLEQAGEVRWADIVHSGQAFGRKLVRQVQVDRIDDLLHQR